MTTVVAISTMKPKAALIIVDMQNDFISGALAVPRANEIVAPIQEYAAERWLRHDYEVVLTRCWHPADHCSFKEYGGVWPAHCVQRSWGAEFQIGLECMRTRMTWGHFSKGMNKVTEEYSAWKRIESALALAKVGRIEICGLARDYCVEATYADAKAAGMQAEVIEDLCRAVGS